MGNSKIIPVKRPMLISMMVGFFEAVNRNLCRIYMQKNIKT